MMAERIWTKLSPAQADGHACVICSRNFHVRDPAAMAVGRSLTGSQVFACAGVCVSRVRELASALPIPAEALTAAGAAFLEALEAAGEDPRPAYSDDLVAATVLAAAPLVVAAELRRIAAEANTTYRAREMWSVYLQARADELDPR